MDNKQKQLLEKKGWTSTDIAIFLGITEKQAVEIISDIEQKRNYSPANLRAARAYLDLTITKLSKELNCSQSIISAMEKYAELEFSDTSMKIVIYYILRGIKFNINRIETRAN